MKKYTHHLIAILSSYTFAAGAYANSYKNPYDAPKNIKQKRYIEAALATGVARFHDIPFPLVAEDLRADGKLSGDEPQGIDHVGLPVSLKLGLVETRSKINFSLGMDFLLVSALSGTVQTLDSSYNRYSIYSGLSKNLSKAIEVSMALSLRRESFLNVSLGHAMESLIAKYTLGYRSQKSLFSIYFHHTLLSRFGVYSAGSMANRIIPETKSGSVGCGGSYHFFFNKNASLFLALERESTNIEISDAYKYEKVGIKLTDEVAYGSINYKPITSFALLGLSKKI